MIFSFQVILINVECFRGYGTYGIAGKVYKISLQLLKSREASTEQREASNIWRVQSSKNREQREASWGLLVPETRSPEGHFYFNAQKKQKLATSTKTAPAPI